MNFINILPTTWTWTKINEIAFVNPKNNYFNVTLDLPVTFVPMAAVDDISGTIMKPVVMGFEEARKGHTKFLENDVIFARITPCMENGKIAIARNLKNGLGFGSTEFHVMRAKKGILPEYIYHYVRQERFRNFAAGFMTSTVGQLRVSKEIMENAKIPLSPSNEQKRIVSKIEELFKESKTTRQALDKVQQILKKLRLSALASAADGRLTTEWRKSHDNIEPASVHIEKYQNRLKEKYENELLSTKSKKRKKPENLGCEFYITEELPKGWAVVKFVNFCVLQRGFDLPKHQRKSGSYPIVASNGIIDYHSEFKVRGPGVTTGRSGSIGKVAYVDEDFWPLNTSLYVRDFNGNIPKFVYYYLMGFNFEVFSASTAVPTLNRNVFFNELVKVPPILEQEEIVSRIDTYFELTNKIEKSVEVANKRADSIDQAILAKAFRGELVPQDPDDESASVLLGRINQKKELESEVKSSRKKVAEKLAQ